MDITEFLASMQGSASDRALMRNTRQAAPDADNDPRTKDAAPANDLAQTEQQGDQGGYDDAQAYGSRQAIADDEQQFEDGGEVEGDDGGDEGGSEDKNPSDDKYANLPESKNIDDRRGEDPLVNDPREDWRDRLQVENYREKVMMNSPLRDDFGTDGPVAKFDDGGEVEPEELEQGAIPDEGAAPEQPGQPPAEQQAPTGFQARREAVNARKNSQQPEDESWRNDAMEGVTAGLNYGRNLLHAVNRPVSDDTHESDVEKYLNGTGSMDPQQFQAAQQSVDPEGMMDPASRLQKTIGSLYKFYSDKYGADSTEPHSPAQKVAWSALQYARKAYNAYATHATVADDRGNNETAAKSATGAFNQVPDGLLADVQFVDGKYVTTFVDPESGKRIDQKELSSEQLKHVLAQGFDRLIEKGTPGGVTNGAQRTEGHQRIGQQRDQYGLTGEDMTNLRTRALDRANTEAVAQSRRQPPAQDTRGFGPADPGKPFIMDPEENGLPPGTNTRGMSIGRVGELRKAHEDNQIKNAATTPAERTAQGQNTSRETIAQRNNQAATQREHIRAGNDPETGKPLSGGGPSGRNAARDSNMETQAQRAAKAEWEGRGKDGAEHGKSYEQVLDFWRKKYNTYGAQGQGGQQQAPQQQQQPMAAGEKEINGWVYKANPQTKQWEPVRKAQ